MVSSHKAWAGSLGAVLAMIVSRMLVEYLPALTDEDYPMLFEALSVVISLGIGYAVTWWGPANRPLE